VGVGTAVTRGVRIGMWVMVTPLGPGQFGVGTILSCELGSGLFDAGVSLSSDAA
jgi:hypothetical protein